MSAGLYDDLVQTSAPGAAAAAGPSSLYADLAPPALPDRKQAPPVTAADRVQAGEAGFRRGAAYLATLVPDSAANAVNLARAGLGAAYGLTHTSETADPLRTPGGLYHFIAPDGSEHFSKEPPPAGSKPATQTQTDIPSALEVNGGVSPVGGALTGLMDKSPITTTQVARPDDTASRYISTVASVIPGVLSGGEATIPSVVRGTVAAGAPAAAGQYVAENAPQSWSDSSRNAAAVLTQALGSTAMPRVRGAPVQSTANDAVRAGQEAGYVFPPGTTNPSPGNRFLSSVAGKSSIDQHATVENQPITNNQGRAAMGLPASDGPISDVEIAQAKAAAAPGYQAMRGAGQIVTPMDWTQRLSAALNKQSGASRLDPSLTDSQLNTTVANLSRLKNFDSSDAMDTIDALRDRASSAFRDGNAQAGRAYRDTSKVIEDAIDSDLSRSGQSDVVQNFRDARQRFAAISTVEENRNPTTGNLQAQKLAAALKGGDYLGPDGAPLRVAAQAAGQAPKAFAEPTTTPGSSHLGFWGSVLGAAELGHMLPIEHGGAAAAIPFAYQGARLGARKYALGPGQGGAVQYQSGTVDPRLLLGGLTSAPGNLSTP